MLKFPWTEQQLASIILSWLSCMNTTLTIITVCRSKTKVPPEPIVRLGLAIIRGMHRLENLMVPAPMRVADLAFGSYSLAEVIRTAAAMGIADKLATGPMTAQALANELGRH